MHIIFLNFYLFSSSTSGTLEMIAFQDSFPSIFAKVATNDTDWTCSFGNGGNTDWLVVSVIFLRY